MTVRDLAREEVVTAPPEATVRELAGKMKEETVGCVVVVEDGKPVGIVTDRDIVVRTLAREKEPSDFDARDLMTEDLVTVEEKAGLYDLLRGMSEEAVRRIPFVDSLGDLVGIITLDDVIVLLAGELEELSAVIESESPRTNATPFPSRAD